jgi:hypothetical protein
MYVNLSTLTMAGREGGKGARWLAFSGADMLLYQTRASLDADNPV